MHRWDRSDRPSLSQRPVLPALILTLRAVAKRAGDLPIAIGDKSDGMHTSNLRSTQVHTPGTQRHTEVARSH
jgi:hypothetical protein